MLLIVARDRAFVVTDAHEVVEACNHIIDVSRAASSPAAGSVEERVVNRELTVDFRRHCRRSCYSDETGSQRRCGG